MDLRQIGNYQLLNKQSMTGELQDEGRSWGQLTIGIEQYRIRASGTGQSEVTDCFSFQTHEKVKGEPSFDLEFETWITGIRLETSSF